MIAVAVALLALTGCVATGDVVAPAAEVESPAPRVTPTPTPVSSPSPAAVFADQVYTGVGTGETEKVVVTVPAGAQSVSISITCVGESQFGVEYGDSMALGQAMLGGWCDGTYESSWPLLPASGDTVNVFMGEGIEWEVVVTFSRDPFDEDEALTRECSAFSDVLSQLQNADDGYGFYAAFGAAEWYDRVDAATYDLAELAESSSSELTESFSAILAILQERDRVAGGALEDVWGNYGPISDACDRNQTPLVIMAEFGG
ncbi:MAG TPA: hypothetical protein DHW40_04080 [Microbacterium sp.]|nr:hypothetical protein [Microbacterium sp.]